MMGYRSDPVHHELGDHSNITGFENLVGGERDDVLGGDNGANVIFGLSGKDDLSGGAGDDTLYGDNSAIAEIRQKYGTGDSSWRSGYSDTITGGAGDDKLIGGGGNDHLDGGTGADTITGGSGTDTFILRAGDGGSSLSDADVFTDFKAGEDVLGLDHSLRYSDLVITQGEAGNSADTVIKTTNGEYLTALKNTTATDIDATNFTTLSTDPTVFDPTNLSPTSISFVSSITEIEEHADTTARTLIGELTVADDGVGTNTLSLTGVDAESFELDGTTLYLKAGVQVDYATQSSYTVTISAVDLNIPDCPPATLDYTLSVTAATLIEETGFGEWYLGSCADTAYATFVEEINGWKSSTGTIELRNNVVQDGDAAEGTQFIELNTDPRDSFPDSI